MQKEKLDLILSIVFSSLFMLMLMAAAVLLFRIYLRRKNRLLLEKERMSQEFERNLLRSRLEIQEQTFSHISREIHDNIGQVLSMLRINLNTVNCSEEQSKLNLMDELLGKAITDLRSLSHLLNGELIRTEGWVKAVEKLFGDLHRSGIHKTTLHVEDHLPPLGEDKPIILFRMIQEVINNVIKHADASEISMQALKQNGKLLIVLTDNGNGFDTGAVAAGAGLNNLTSRASMINATLELRSQPGEGSSVVISINPDGNE